MSDDARTRLTEVLNHDRALAEAVDRLLALEGSAVVAALTEVVEGGTEGSSEDVERRLVRVAAILSDLAGREAAALLLRLLDSPSPVVRAAAGEALLDLAVDGPMDVLEAATSIVGRTDLSRALVELPYLLAEVGHGRAPQVVTRLLDHPDGAVVAAALEALTWIGDPSAASAIRSLQKDGRVVAVPDEEGTEVEGVPLSVLASEALEALSAKGRRPRRRR